MEGLEISGMERSKTGGGSTGFDFYGEDDTVSELDICAGDEMDLEQDYFEKLRIQRERVSLLSKLDVKVRKMLCLKVAAANQISKSSELADLRNLEVDYIYSLQGKV